MHDIKKKLTETENTINARLGEMQNNEKKILTLRSTYERNALEIQQLGQDIELEQMVIDTKVQRNRLSKSVINMDTLGTCLSRYTNIAATTERHYSSEKLGKGNTTSVSTFWCRTSNVAHNE